MKTIQLALLGGLAVAGCVAAPADHHADVRRELSTRVGPIWSTPSGPISQAVDKIVAEPLTIDSATRLALINHPRVRATLARLDVAEADLAQAGLLSNPTFDADAKFFDSGANIEAAVAMNVLDVFALPMRKRLAEGEYAVARREVLLSLLDLVRDARVALTRAQAAIEQTALRERLLELSDLRAEYAHHVHDAGNMSDLDLALVDADAEQARADLTFARSAEMDARERLNVALGLFGPAASGWKVGPLPSAVADVGSLDAIESDAVRASVLLDRDRAGLAAGEASLGFRRAFAWGTDLHAGAAAEREPEGDWGLGRRSAGRSRSSIPARSASRGRGRRSTRPARSTRRTRSRSGRRRETLASNSRCRPTTSRGSRR